MHSKNKQDKSVLLFTNDDLIALLLSDSSSHQADKYTTPKLRFDTAANRILRWRVRQQNKALQETALKNENVGCNQDMAWGTSTTMVS